MNRSIFPAGIDTFVEHYDIQASDMPNIERYKKLIEKPSLTSLERTELENLTTILREKIFLPEDFNKLQDCITNLQIFFRDNVEGYIQTKQDEFDALINRFSYKGLYDSTATYQKFNIVTYNHESYLAKRDNLIGRTPTGYPDDVNWGKISSRGSQGVAGLGLSYLGQYNNATAYRIGNAVTYNGSVYFCKVDSVGNVPTNETYWDLFMSHSGFTVSDTPPPSPVLFQFWVDTN